MSRSGYSDDVDDQWGLIRWRGAVKSALRGARGQAALREVLAALDSMQEKELIAESLVTADGEFCTLGALGAARGIDTSQLDPEDWDSVARAFNLAPAMVREIVYLNDEWIDEYRWVEVEICGPVRPYRPEWGRHTKSVQMPNRIARRERWEHMRKWVADQIIQEKGPTACA